MINEGSESAKYFTQASRKKKLEVLMDSDEVLADFKQNAVIDDYLDD